MSSTELPKHREACNACHKRKVRCSVEGPGACLNCQQTGRVCMFSPRHEMGRPRKNKKDAGPKATRPSAAAMNRRANSGPIVKPRMTIEEASSSVPLLSPRSSTNLSPRSDFYPWVNVSKESSLPVEALGAPGDGSSESGYFNIQHGINSSKSRSPYIDLDNGIIPEAFQENQEQYCFGGDVNSWAGDLEMAAVFGSDQTNAIDAIPTDSSSDDDNNSNGQTRVQRLTSLLFDLQVASSRLQFERTGQAVDGETIIPLVTSLCDLLFAEITTTDSTANSQAALETWLLFCTAVSLVITMYRSLCLVPKDETPFSFAGSDPAVSVSTAHDNANNPWLRPTDDHGKEHSLSSQSVVASRAHQLSQLTIMDFQLQTMEPLFKLGACQNLLGLTVVREALSGLRKAIQGSMQDLRAFPVT